MFPLKKALFCASFFSISLLIFSCKSTDVDSADSYQDEEQVTNIAISKNTSSASSSSDPYSKEKIRGNRSFGERLFNVNKYTKVKTSNLTITNTLGSPKVKKSTFIYKPETDMGGILVHYDTSYYALYLAQRERNVLISAVKNYLADFENKNLDKKLKKSDRVYGQVNGYEEFGIVEQMMTNCSKPKIYFGYRFLKNHPYFCIYSAKALNLAVDQKDKGAVKYSVDQKYYFTKAQAQELAEFLSDENIDSLASPAEKATVEDDTVDEY